MSVLKSPQNGTNLLQTALAKPYHYRRSGRYYLRLRQQGATQGFFTLSLRTTDKATAMQISKDILKTLSLFHLDNPKASWRELKERLITIAEECLTMAHCSGLMKPDTHLGENARPKEVSDDQATPYLYP